MGYTVCFANNKGGVGKTTTSVAIGQAWARMGKKILFVDLDSQANLTSMVSPLAPEDHKLTIRDAFIDKNNFSIEHVKENIDLIPSELSLSNFDRDTAAVTGREYLLVDLLKPVKNKYDFIIIDSLRGRALQRPPEPEHTAVRCHHHQIREEQALRHVCAEGARRTRRRLH